MSVRAKFKVQSITRQLQSVYKNQEWTTQEVQTVKLAPVTGAGENAAFWAATPSGEIQLGCANHEAANQFGLGDEFYVDFTPALTAEAMP